MEDNVTLRRIRLLIAKAEGTDNQHESELFMAAAMKLMAKHGIERAMLKDPSQREEIKAVTIECEAPFAMEKITLLNQVALNSQCYGYRNRKIKSRKGSMFYALSGFPSDLERVQLLYTSLLLQSARELDRVARRDAWELRGQTLAAWKRSFLNGYSAVINQRLKKAKADAVSETEDRHSTEVALVDRQTEVETWTKQQNEELQAGKQRKLTGDGTMAGALAGARANLGGGTGIANGSAGQISR